MFRRIALFLMINILVVATISVVLSVLGVRPYLTTYGLDLEALAIFCLVWGMVGSCISLALSRKMAKWLMRVKLVGPDHEVYKMVARLARDANLPDTPEVGIFDSPQMNAFATGPTKRRSLVAVSSGLISQMEKGELEAVLAHEVSHISNGDMVTMTLIQGIVNAFVMFLARVLAYAVTSASRSNNRRFSYGSYYLFTILFEIVFMIAGTLVVTAFSRMREYRADRGAAILTRKEQMIAALERLKGVRTPTETKKSAMNALMISMPRRGMGLFSTHPSLDARIERLKELPGR
ncbi:protease HtpX [Candidatus Neptunochlamydia vexilliferae]|nr:protease HtpX [Candidatus Neptunochlamydia vexilliferae]